ncbi:MAG: hypothetical protein COA99_07180 [Moraxellaceae bacterium]|nr:MAG: hypothetical protein COA99_07180 [Moraxellaceae bacterium]
MTDANIDSALAAIAAAKSSHQAEICLNFHDLTEIPSALWELTNTTHLYLTGNQLESIPGDIQQLTRLQHLDLSGNKINQLPKEIFLLEKLNTLDISSNELTQIPDDIALLRNLTTFDCFGNNLSTLPETLGECLNLTSLSAGKNELINLPKSIGKLSHLESLDLSYNEIEQLPSSIHALSQLENLDLAGNKINMPFSYFEKYQYEPSLLLKKIHELQHKQSHAQFDQYRKQKQRTATAANINTFDNNLVAYDISGNQLLVKVTLTTESLTLSNTASFLESLNNDLLIAWTITHSIQGASNQASYANPLMDRCFNDAQLTISNIDTECDKLIKSIQSPPPRQTNDQQHSDYPSSKIIRCHVAKHLSVTCQLSAPPRALLYLTYLWSLWTFNANNKLPFDAKRKKELLEIITRSLEGHGLTLKNDPRIPLTLLCLSQRQQHYQAEVYS